MQRQPIAVVILAAGKGTRMLSDRPKVLHGLAGRPMIGHVTATVDRLRPERVVVVVGPDMDAVAALVRPHETVVQPRRLGTADAVKCARDALAGFEGDVLVLCGDTPLILPETLERVLARRRAAPEPAVVVLGFRPDDPTGYGRLIGAPDGSLEAIVEDRDANEAERAITLCNAGVIAVDGAHLFALLERIGTDNAKGEYYLTDLVAVARAAGLACATVEADAEEVAGVNSRADLAAAEAAMQARLRARAMADGATLVAPETVFLCHDTRLGRETVIGPIVVFGPGVEVADGAEIRAFSHLEGARVGPGAVVGPFARLRPGADLDARVRVGNFVEVKNARLEEGAKANHLSYIGDARVGAGANVGAGTITCNYDGFVKSFTDIGAGAFIGSNVALVAPVKIGDGAVVAAGSTIAGDVARDALAITRAPREERAAWAVAYRKRGKAKKAALKNDKNDE